MTNLKPVHGSQQFLLTLLGTYFLGVEDEIPSTFFVDVLGDFGLSETAARNAVSRVARQGFLEPARRGRATYYSLTETARQPTPAPSQANRGFRSRVQGLGRALDGYYVLG